MKKTNSITQESIQFNHDMDLSKWEISGLFKDTIWAEFIDEIKGEKTTRAGIIVPENSQSLKDFYRIARVLKAGPDCSDNIEEGVFLLLPPAVGVFGINKGPNGGRKSFFIPEDKVMAVIAPKTEDAVSEVEERF